MLTKILVIVMSVLLVDRCSCFDYCTIPCKTHKHTMCEYPAGGGDDCMKDQQFTAEDKSALLYMHNKLRQRVALGEQEDQPPAGNMMELTWDDELAMIAQRWAEQCQMDFEHDACRTSQDGSPVGQNLRGGSTTDMETLVSDWFKEVADFDPANVITFMPQEFGRIGHYSQLVWADTRSVGCGYSGDANTLFIKYVCNYKPGGNVVGTSMYKAGTPCSECPAGTKCSKKYPGLCANNSEPYTSTASIVVPINITNIIFIVSIHLIIYLNFK